MAQLNGHKHNGSEEMDHLNEHQQGQEIESQDELVLDMTDPDVSYMVGMTVVTFQDMGIESEVPEMQEQLRAIFEAYEAAEDEFTLVGDAIPVFVYMVYEMASMIDEGEIELEGTEEYLAVAEDFLVQVETAFPDIIEELLSEDVDDEDDEEGVKEEEEEEEELYDDRDEEEEDEDIFDAEEVYEEDKKDEDSDDERFSDEDPYSDEEEEFRDEDLAYADSLDEDEDY